MCVCVHICLCIFMYIACLCNCIEPKIENLLRKNQNGLERNRSTISQILTIHRNLVGVNAKNLVASILFVDFTMAFYSIHRGKMEKNFTCPRPTKRNYHSHNDAI